MRGVPRSPLVALALRLVIPLAIGLTACSSTPPPRPLRGPVPSTILVLPVDAAGVPRELVALLDDYGHLPLVDRGYGVIPANVARNMIESLPMPIEAGLSPEVLDELNSRYEVDAVLLRSVRRDPPSGAGSGFVIDWELIGLDGGLLWEWSEAGGPRRTSPLPDGPTLLGGDPLYSDDPLVQRRFAGLEPIGREPSLVEQVDAVHRRVASALPSAR